MQDDDFDSVGDWEEVTDNYHPPASVKAPPAPPLPREPLPPTPAPAAKISLQELMAAARASFSAGGAGLGGSKKKKKPKKTGLRKKKSKDSSGTTIAAAPASTSNPLLAAQPPPSATALVDLTSHRVPSIVGSDMRLSYDWTGLHAWPSREPEVGPCSCATTSVVLYGKMTDRQLPVDALIGAFPLVADRQGLTQSVLLPLPAWPAAVVTLQVEGGLCTIRGVCPSCALSALQTVHDMLSEAYKPRSTAAASRSRARAGGGWAARRPSSVPFRLARVTYTSESPIKHWKWNALGRETTRPLTGDDMTFYEHAEWGAEAGTPLCTPSNGFRNTVFHRVPSAWPSSTAGWRLLSAEITPKGHAVVTLTILSTVTLYRDDATPVHTAARELAAALSAWTATLLDARCPSVTTDMVSLVGPAPSVCHDVCNLRFVSPLSQTPPLFREVSLALGEVAALPSATHKHLEEAGGHFLELGGWMEDRAKAQAVRDAFKTMPRTDVDRAVSRGLLDKANGRLQTGVILDLVAQELRRVGPRLGALLKEARDLGSTSLSGDGVTHMEWIMEKLRLLPMADMLHLSSCNISLVSSKPTTDAGRALLLSLCLSGSFRALLQATTRGTAAAAGGVASSSELAASIGQDLCLVYRSAFLCLGNAPVPGIPLSGFLSTRHGLHPTKAAALPPYVRPHLFRPRVGGLEDEVMPPMALALDRFVGSLVCSLSSLSPAHAAHALILTTCLFGGVGSVALPMAIHASQARHKPRMPSPRSSSPIEVEPLWDTATQGTPPSFSCPLRQWDAVKDFLTRATPPFFDFAGPYERSVLSGRLSPFALRLCILVAIHTPAEACESLMFTPPPILTALAGALSRSMRMPSLISLLSCAARVLDGRTIPFARKLVPLDILRRRVGPGVSMVFHEALLMDAWLRMGITPRGPEVGPRCTSMSQIEAYVTSGAIPSPTL